MLLDKKILLTMFAVKVRDTADFLLRKNNFYQDDCWFNATCNGEAVKKIQGHRLVTLAEAANVANYQALNLSKSYQLLGHFKTYTKITVIKWYFFGIGSRICEDDRQYVGPDFPLIQIDYSNLLSFSLTSSKQLQMSSSMNMNGNVLCDACNKPWSTPYTARRTMQFPLAKTSVIDLGQDNPNLHELMQILLANTKRINITEDESYYYIYCVK